MHTAAVHGRQVWAFVITTEDASADTEKQITLQSREILVVADELVGRRLSLRGQVVHRTARHADSLARHRLHIRLQSSGVKLKLVHLLSILYELHSKSRLRQQRVFHPSLVEREGALGHALVAIARRVHARVAPVEELEEVVLRLVVGARVPDARD